MTEQKDRVLPERERHRVSADEVFKLLDLATHYVEVAGTVLRKPIYGGAFGHGAFEICSASSIVHRLHQTCYIVRHVESGAAVGIGGDQADALAAARAVLTKAPELELRAHIAKHLARREQQQAARLAREREAAQESEKYGASQQKIKSIPRRRKQIFDECSGQCHYCGTALTLDGKWHIEHKMPKALGGGSEPGNLVASCVSCNWKKRDRTDLEFIAQQKAGGA